MKFGHRHTAWMPSADEGKDWSDPSTSKRMPRIACNLQKLGRGGKEGSSPTDVRGRGSAHTLILDFQSPRVMRQ